jgi:hypothetical protein
MHRSELVKGQTVKGGIMPRRSPPADHIIRGQVDPAPWKKIVLREASHKVGTRAAGGGAPGWRPCPFGLVGAGSGVGVGRRGDYLRGKKKDSIKHSVPGPTRSILTQGSIPSFFLIPDFNSLASGESRVLATRAHRHPPSARRLCRYTVSPC